MKSSDLLVKCLENEGVEYIFGIPGEENLDFLESLRTSSIRLILTRHEQSAGFMAATYGRLTGKTGVCLSTLGPGATNFVTAAAYAQLGAMPMMMITGQKPIKKSKQGRFQIINTVEMMKPLTKFSKQIVDGSLIPSIIREAFRIAEDERPGAVHIELPEDIADEQTDRIPLKKVNVRRPIAERKALQTAIEMIQASHHPLLVVGAGANRKRVYARIAELSEKTGIPFCNTQMGKGLSKKLLDKYIGTTALSDGDLVHMAINNADLIINIGHDVMEKPPFFMEGKTVMHINFSPADIDDVYNPQHEVVGDIANALWYIEENIIPQPHWDFSYFKKVQLAIRTEIDSYASCADFPMVPPRIVSDIRNAMPENGIVCLDNGMYKIWFAKNYFCYEQNTLLLDNALATMGAGLPSAIAAKLVFPEKKVMAVCGDGGFMMNSQELETAIRLGLDLVVVILNDSGYGMIKWKQTGMGFETFGLDYTNPDFVKYAESYGANGYRVQSIEELEPLLNNVLEKKGVHVIEVPINYDLSAKLLSSEYLSQKKKEYGL